MQQLRRSSQEPVHATDSAMLCSIGFESFDARARYLLASGAGDSLPIFCGSAGERQDNGHGRIAVDD